jgi:hypothetical protein
VALDAERRARLQSAKLAALVTGATGAAASEIRPGTFPGGAALVDGDGRAWVLVEDQGERALGPALAWARQQGATGLDVVVSGDAVPAAGVLARRASLFATAPRVWEVAGRDLVAVAPAPLPVEPPLDHRLRSFSRMVAAAGADPVVEHGRLIGEVSGLEVVRVEVVGDAPVVEIGVGRFDREAHALVSHNRPTEEALADVVTLVRRHRRPDAPHHPLKRLAAARWLRSRVVAHPSLVGADHLAPVPPVSPPPDLRTAWPAPAAGVDIEGGPLVVVCSTGVDLDLVPTAAEARLADGRDARLLLAVAPRDDHPVTRALAGSLLEPAEIVHVADED